jgi:hypothetical protein
MRVAICCADRELPIFGFLAVVGGLLGAVFNEINQKLSVQTH